MQTVAVDIVGPFPTSPAGNNYILVAMDYFICVNVVTNSIQKCFEEIISYTCFCTHQNIERECAWLKYVTVFLFAIQKSCKNYMICICSLSCTIPVTITAV